MPKLNIYVSDDLKREMDRHEDQNWSFVAQLAFQENLNRLRQGKSGLRYVTDKDFIDFVRQALAALDYGRNERATKLRRMSPRKKKIWP